MKESRIVSRLPGRISGGSFPGRSFWTACPCVITKDNKDKKPALWLREFHS